MKVKNIWGILFLFLIHGAIVRADTIPLLSSAIHLNYGFIIPHSRAIEPVSHTNPAGVEISLNTLHLSPYSMRVFNSYWFSGIQAGYFNFQNPDIGTACTITLFAEPVIAFNNSFMFTVRGGAGLSFNTRIYDEETDTVNKFFSTRVSFSLYISTTMRYRVADNLLLSLSGNFNHISNGGFRQPNYGMNFPTLSAGAEYYFKGYNSPPNIVHKTSDVQKRSPYLTAGTLVSLRVADKTDLFPEKKCTAIGFQVRYARPLGQIYSLNGGAEFILDGFIKEKIYRENGDEDYKRLAITAGQDFMFGNVFFVQYFGVYVYSPYPPPRRLYQKYELSYKFRNGFMAGVFLKAHLQEAEMLGIGFYRMISAAKN